MLLLGASFMMIIKKCNGWVQSVNLYSVALIRDHLIGSACRNRIAAQQCCKSSSGDNHDPR